MTLKGYARARKTWAGNITLGGVLTNVSINIADDDALVGDRGAIQGIVNLFLYAHFGLGIVT